MVIEIEIDTGDKGPTSYCVCMFPFRSFAKIWKICPDLTLLWAWGDAASCSRDFHLTRGEPGGVAYGPQNPSGGCAAGEAHTSTYHLQP